MWCEDVVKGGDTRFFVRSLGETRHDDDTLAVLLHGWPQDGSSWSAVAPPLVDAGYRVACPDLKGFGRSDAPRRGYDPETLGDEISQLIRNLDARKALLVGHDLGGAVALATAFRHPGRVRALVTVSAPFRHLGLRAAWHVPLMNLPVAPQFAFRLAGIPLTRAALRSASVRREPFTDEVVRRYGEAVSRTPTGWLGYYRTLSRRAIVDGSIRQLRRRVPLVRAPDEPHRLRVPAVVVWGHEDHVTPFHLGALAARDLSVDIVGIPGVGHFVPEEAPEALVEAILDLAGPAQGVDRPADGRAG